LTKPTLPGIGIRIYSDSYRFNHATPRRNIPEQPTRAEVSLGRLRNNFEIVRSLVGKDVKIMAMVKSNAYGHGIKTRLRNS